MGFFIGVITYICSYFMLGPILMSFYTTYNSENNENSNSTLFIGVILTGIYIGLWILLFAFLSKYIVWCIPGAIVGLICAIVTFNKNKEQTLINIDSNKSSINNNLKGTEALLSVVISEIKKNGIDYISEDNPLPYICQIMQYFDKEEVEFIIEKYNPNLNIKFQFNEYTKITPLDYMVIIENLDMFKLLVKKGAKSSNNYNLAMIAIHTNLYDVLNYVLTLENFKINTNLKSVIRYLEDEVEDCTLYDYAIVCNAHEKIITLLEEKGAKSIFDIEDDTSNVKDITQKIFNLYSGHTEKFSKAELVSFAIDLKSFKKQLSEEKYKKATLKFEEYEKKKELKEYTQKTFIIEIMKLQDEFSNIIDEPIDFDGKLKK